MNKIKMDRWFDGELSSVLAASERAALKVYQKFRSDSRRTVLDAGRAVEVSIYSNADLEERESAQERSVVWSSDA